MGSNYYSADLMVSINGATPTTTALTSLNIASAGSATVSQSSGWTPAASRTYTVEAWLTNLNGGNVDSNPEMIKPQNRFKSYLH